MQLDSQLKKSAKKLIIRYLPYFLAIVGAGLGFIDYLLDEMEIITNNFEWIIWTVNIAFLTFVGFRIGIFIRKIYSRIYKDTLTGLMNRGYFYFKLDNEMSKINGNTGLSLAMVDIDNFKSINDTFGHIEGDVVIKKIANLIKSNVRATDSVVRWGGEEFAIILPKTNLKGSHNILDKVRKGIEDEEFNYKGNTYKVTISCGIAWISRGMNQDEFVALADKALYVAKENKNTIVDFQ